ncbi:DNA primase [candidate division Kazan bacterium RBG_13_50_9]|uniref:DNA primase n=1 Tax=candidate division Kazan bacterium RBG_13_50_9 TaxID=1798535 RepID=A0A1F4NS83_UNCK3|nr:MAG: DNA primase [candidate division Kazan bacterium RBG_13_50_9]
MNEIDEIKNKVDIIDLIGSFVPLKKAGRNYKGLCPFHSEKTPSFMVSQEKQIWHCFGCGKGGDIFGFLIEKEGISFSEALVQLAERAGVELKSRPQDWGERNKLFAINELAAKFFERSLSDSKEGRQAMNYLVNRGINKETVATFRLGYAPSGWEYLSKLLLRRGYQVTDAERAGLAIKRDRGYSDKFRHRLMFPIASVSGRVVGFTGRVLDPQDQPKYLNSPETPIFNKGKVLYGLSVTKEDIQSANSAVLVEGQMDVLASYQAGIRNVVASSGTALTIDQLRSIRRYTETLILALDADSAGSEATKRAIELASAEDLDIKVALLGDFKDPDECIKAGVDQWRAVVQSAVPIVDFYISYSISKFGSDSVAAKKKVAAEVLPVIAALDSPVEKDQYAKKLAEAIAVDVQSLYEAIAKTRRGRVAPQPLAAKEQIQIESRDPHWLEKRLLGIILYKPAQWAHFRDKLDAVNWASPPLAQIYGYFKDCYTGREFSLDELLGKLEYPDKVEVLELMMVIEENYADMPDVDIGQELNFYINLLKQRNTRVEMMQLSREIADAEKSGDQVKLQALLEKFKESK